MANEKPQVNYHMENFNKFARHENILARMLPLDNVKTRVMRKTCRNCDMYVECSLSGFGKLAISHTWETSDNFSNHLSFAIICQDNKSLSEHVGIVTLMEYQKQIALEVAGGY